MQLKNTKSKEDKYLFRKEYHKRLEQIVEKNFGIDVVYSENFSWGYTSTSTYIKDVNDNEFIARISDATLEKERVTKKDIEINSKINLSVETRKYIPNKEGHKMTYIKEEKDSQGNILMQDRMLTFYPYLQGMPPFDMTKEIFEQAVKILHEIHQIDPKIFSCKLPRVEGAQKGEEKFLHGDMTPSNMLVSYDKIEAIVDFELACIGPAEYDIARGAVFSWFRMKTDQGLGNLLEFAQKIYPDELNQDLLKKYAIEHTKSHLENIKGNKGRYQNIKDYRKERRFTQKMLRRAKRELRSWKQA